MKLIVGLGNPGQEYNNTRHNIGFMCLDHFAKNQSSPQFKEKFNGLYSKFNINSEPIILLKPLSYMNLSGTVVKKFADYFKIEPQDILIIHDDLDMPVGKVKLKKGGSSGGHNGIKNIISELNTENFNHLKLGISKNNNYDIKDYVLGQFTSQDKQIIDDLMPTIDQIIHDIITNPFEKCMSKYNGVIK